MDIKRINQFTGDILDSEQKVEALKTRLDVLRNGKGCFTAKMSLRIGDSRFESNEYLTRDEVITVLERLLKEKSEVLEKFKSVFALENEGITA